MRRLLIITALALTTTSLSAQSWLDPYKPIAQKLIAESQRTDFAWRRLAEVTDTYGPRLSGSDNLELAIDWALETMKKDGFARFVPGFGFPLAGPKHLGQRQATSGRC